MTKSETFKAAHAFARQAKAQGYDYRASFAAFLKFPVATNQVDALIAEINEKSDTFQEVIVSGHKYTVTYKATNTNQWGEKNGSIYIFRKHEDDDEYFNDGCLDPSFSDSGMFIDNTDSFPTDAYKLIK